MGRPDTLGADLYHNRPLPMTTSSADGVSGGASQSIELLEPPQCAILELMVDFSRIIRRIRLELYVVESPATGELGVALQHAASIEQDLDRWLDSLPVPIKPQHGPVQNASLKSAKEPQYAKKQRLVLAISTCRLVKPFRPPLVTNMGIAQDIITCAFFCSVRFLQGLRVKDS